jgi:hypothetical protein
LYNYYKPKKGLADTGVKDYNFTEDDIYRIWDRLEYLRSITKNTQDAQAKDWIMPNKTGKSKLEEPIEQYILKLQSKDNDKKDEKDKKDETITESKKVKQINLLNFNSVQLANLAVSGMLKKFPQFVSPKDIEDEIETSIDTTGVKALNTPIKPTTEAVVKESYRVQKRIEKIIKGK